jgi:hypothetical protein
MVTVSPFAEPILLGSDTVTVPVPGVGALDEKLSVSVFEFNPFSMVIVWPLVGPVPEKVPVADAPVPLLVRLNMLPAPVKLVTVIVGAEVDEGNADTVPIAEAVVALLVRLNVLELLPAELVTVMVGAVLDVGAADTVPIAEAVVALVVRLNTLLPFLIVAAWPAPGAPVNVPVALAVVGALAVKVCPSTVTVELPPLALLVVTVPVALAATPPIATFQSFFSAVFLPLPPPGAVETGPTSGVLAAETSPPSAAFAPPLRLICCIV